MNKVILYLASLLTPALAIALIGFTNLPMWADILTIIVGVFVVPAVIFGKSME